MGFFYKKKMDTKYINEILEKDIQSLGCTIWGVDLFGRYKNQTLRIYIDNKEGISIEDCESGSTPGKYGAEFKIKLDEDWFKPGDVITPDKNYLCRVQREPIADGDGFIYYVQLMGDDQDAFLDPDYTKVGVQWSKLFSVYEEGGDQSGSTTYAMPMKLRSNLSTYRKE